MSVRLPSVRDPHSFYDVFGVVAAAVTVMALVLAVRYGTVVRIEMVVFVMLVFLWAVWAIERILHQSEAQSEQRQSPWSR